jgi:precorrin-4 methylase
VIMVGPALAARDFTESHLYDSHRARTATAAEPGPLGRRS